jgi:WD40 repeat protein
MLFSQITLFLHSQPCAVILITSDDCGTGSVRFWDITGNKGRELFHRNVRAAGGPIPLALSDDGSWLAITDNNSISIWDASTGFDLFVLPNDWYALDTAFSVDGKYFVAGGRGTTIKVWSLSLSSEKLAITAHDGERIGAVAFSPDGTRLVTESLLTSDTRIWDIETGKQVLSIKVPDICCSVAFSSDGTQIVTASTKGEINVWDAITGKKITTLSGSAEIINDVVFSPDGTRIATAGGDGVARVWDAVSGKQLTIIIARNPGWVVDVEFSPDGKLLATSSADTSLHSGMVSIWDTTTGEFLFGLGNSYNTSTYGLAFSPDGNRIAVGYGDNATRIWDISTMMSQTQPLLVLQGHSNIVWRVAFSPDGTRLATAGFDGIIKLWNVLPGPDQGKETTTFFGHTAEVSGIDFSPDGKYLASVSWDGTLRVYYTQIEDLIAAAKERVTRSLTTEECQKYLHVDVCPAPP